MKINKDIIKYSVAHPLIGVHGDHVNNGMYLIPYRTYKIKIIASSGKGWDHVSVSLDNLKRTPNWDEMCFIKDLFWNKDETVVQFFPKDSEYVNNHQYCLHMWRKHGVNIELPPSYLVGLRSV